MSARDSALLDCPHPHRRRSKSAKAGEGIPAEQKSPLSTKEASHRQADRPCHLLVEKARGAPRNSIRAIVRGNRAGF